MASREFSPSAGPVLLGPKTAEPSTPTSLRRLGASLACLAVLALGGCSAPAPDTVPPTPVPRFLQVVRVIDGDTLTVAAQGSEEKVRLREINTPESGECGADAATELLRRLSADGVELDRRGEDRYGRTLAHIHTRSGLHVQRELVLAGLAHVADYGAPDEHLDSLLAAEAEARLAQRGLYGAMAGCEREVPSSRVEDVHIVEVDANPEGDDVREGGGESVLLEGTPGLPLSGWTLKDTSASHRLRFKEGTALSSDGQLRVFTSCGVPREGVLHWCAAGSAVWNNSGDTAFLLDPAGGLVSWLDYRPGSASPGEGQSPK